jgi:hypothetical protein
MLLVPLLGVAVARADWQTERAEAIAAKLWGNPCAGAVTVRSEAPPEPDWRAWTYAQTCTVVLSNRPPKWQWDELCPILMHEYGHLAGYRDPLNPADPFHSHDPRDIMWPYEHYDRRCDDYGSAFLGIPAPARGGVGRAAASRRRAKAGRAGRALKGRAKRRAGRSAA